ncbi:MAG TPA: DNA polymerase III subunit alpha [Polyangiaceae bacterium]|jgi:DNA polymerase-3 subunit alpha|nr:DNA polymerase III subunit alpha [Polyangiaceae bacterium]
MAAEYNHLHVHTQYSLLDGAVKVKDLVKRVSEGGMRAVAVTDHGNMFGAITLYKAAKEAKVQAILGCELDASWETRAGSTAGHGHHLPLLASSLEGYKNLIWLVSRGQLKGGPLSAEEIAGHSRGLVGMTGCMGGVVAQAILEEGEARGREVLASMRDALEPGALYVELQDHGLPEQPVLNEILLGLARDLDLPLVATNDVHYAERSDAEAHLYLSCIKTGRTLEEAKERHHGSSEMYLKSPAEMAQLFSAHPRAIAATLEIAERCKMSLKLGEPMLPSFVVPDGYDTEGYFRHVAREGLERRLAEFEQQGKKVDPEAYRGRLATELDVIAKMNFAGYFLIVWDFIRYAKETGVPVGPGRGSGAGSIVAYAMRITDLDPIPYNLLFERFLNPERVSMPDFDIDFCMDKRDQVIAYVQRKYGENSVGQIATFAELKSKSVVKDVARCIGITPTEAQQIANLIPRKTPAETYTIAESLGIEPKLKALYDKDPRVKELLDQGQKLEGLTRHAGKHAAGIVISEGPLWDHVPVFKAETRAPGKGADAKDAKNAQPEVGALVTQYYKDDVEQAGLVKFDFLGLKTLTVLDIAVRLVNARPDYVADGKTLDLGTIGKTLDLERIPLDDAPTYKLLASGETKGVFQLESSGMQQLFKDLRPDGFEDVVAAVALYRPGPLGSGMVEDFVNRKHGRAPIASLHPLVDELLAPTYGVIVYQEQVMQIAQKLAGYTLGGADLLRRAMGKKKPEEMAKQKSIFLEGARSKGVVESEAERIFALLEYFAGYGFNKSHSAAYALITYQTAWLKAHYPVELLCAILTSDKDRIDKVVRTIADARAMGVTVLPPDVNESDTDFKVIYTNPKGDKKLRRSVKGPQDTFGPEIRFGLGAVRGLGGAALEAVFEARQGGLFRDLFDLAARVDAKRVNKGVFEALVQCGAFDLTLEQRGVTRARAFTSVDIALERSRAASRDRAAGQTTLFGLFDAAPQQASAPTAGDYVECEPWDRRELLVRERQSLGFYVSGHPLERYLGRRLERTESAPGVDGRKAERAAKASGDAALAKLGAMPIADCAGMDDWAQVKIVGMVEGYRERIFKDGGGKVAFFELEDLTGRVNVKLRARDIDQYAPLLAAGEPVLVSGKVSFPQRGEDAEDEPEGPREPTILLNEVHSLAETVRADTRAIAIRVPAERTRAADLSSLARVLSGAKGTCPVALHVAFADGREAVLSLGDAWKVDVGDALLSGIERIFGQQVAELR